MPESCAVKRDRLGEARKLVFELIVIFLGVYAAFWVDNYRDEKSEAERTREIAQALQKDISDVIRVEQTTVDTVRTGLDEWERARERGETPPPYIFRFRGSERPPDTVFNAILQSRPVELFDSELLFELGYFYSELLGTSDRYVRYATFTESEVLPRLKSGPASFYSTDGGHLLPEYAAHMDRLRELTEFWEADLRRAQDLIERLEPYTN